jgi:excisionase family DNA binding protein
MPGPADPHLTLDDAADALGTGPDFITRLITDGHLDTTGDGDELRIPQSALIAYAVAADGPAPDAGVVAAERLAATPQIPDPSALDRQGVAA